MLEGSLDNFSRAHIKAIDKLSSSYSRRVCKSDGVLVVSSELKPLNLISAALQFWREVVEL